MPRGARAERYPITRGVGAMKTPRPRLQDVDTSASPPSIVKRATSVPGYSPANWAQPRRQARNASRRAARRVMDRLRKLESKRNKGWQLIELSEFSRTFTQGSCNA